MRASHRHSSRGGRIEQLEPRWLLAFNEVVNGTDGNDTIVISTDGSANFVFTVNGVTSTASIAETTNVLVGGLGGNDDIRVERNGGKYINISGGPGNDLIAICPTTGNLGNITGPGVGVRGDDFGPGEEGMDIVTVHDTSVSINIAYELERPYLEVFIRVIRNGLTKVTFDNDVERLGIFAGSGNDTLNNRYWSPWTEVTFSGGDGNDTVRSTGRDESTFYFHGGNGADQIILDASINNSPNFVEAVSVHSDSIKLESTIEYTSVSSIIVNGSDSADPVWIYSTSVPVTVNSGGGNDSIIIYGGNKIAGLVTVNAGPGVDSLVYTSDSNGSNTFTVTTGHFAMNVPGTQGVSFNSEVENAEVQGKSGSDTININSFSASTALTVNGSTGSDTITVNMPQVPGNLVLNGGTFDSGTDTLIIDNSSYGFINIHTLTATTFFASLNTYAYANFESLTYRMALFNSVLRIDSTAAGTPVTVLGGPAPDAVTLGDGPRNLSLLAGPVTFHGNGATNDLLTVRDDNRPAGASYTINNTSITGPGLATFSWNNTTETINFFGSSLDDNITLQTSNGAPAITVRGGDGNDTITADMSGHNGFNVGGPFVLNGDAGVDALIVADAGTSIANISATTFSRSLGATYTYGTFESLTWNGPAEVYTLLSTAAGTPVAINGGDSNNTFNVGGNVLFGQSLGNFPAPLTINAQGGLDTINLVDHNTTMAQSYTLNGGVFTRSGAAPMSFTGAEVLNLHAGSGADTINVLDHPAALTVTVDGRGGLDAVTINGDAAGAATVCFAATQDLADLQIFDGGNAVLNPGGNKLISTTALMIDGAGRLDLTDNALLVDHNGTPPPIWNWLVSGRAGGAWNGPGIMTSAPVAPGNALGYAEVSALPPAALAVLSGISHGQTALLARYTIAPDANLDRIVDVTDLGILASNWQQTGRTFSQADFNYDDVVDVADLGILASAWQKELDAPSASFTRETQPRRPTRLIDQIQIL